MKKKLGIWLLAMLIYLSTFGVPIIAGYITFAEVIEERTGGGFFYFVFFITFIIFLKKIFNAIKKQKAGYTKAIFKLLISMITLYLVYKITTYIQINFEELATLILWSIGGRLLGFVFELIAVRTDKIYLEEIGVV